MEEKFQIAGRALPGLVLIGLSLVVSGGCSSEGSSFGMGGTGNTGTSGSGQTNAGSTGMTTQAMGGNGNNAGSTSTGGNGNNAGSSNPTGGSAGNNAGGGDGPLGGSGGSGPQEEPCPKPAGEICHEFYANDNARNQINYVNEFKIGQMVGGKMVGPDGVIWTAPVGGGKNVNSPRQVEMVDNAQGSGGKAIMVSVNTGWQEFDPVTGMSLVDRTQLGVSGVRGAVRLVNGDTILGVGDDKLRTFNSAGAPVGAECTLPGSGGDSLRVINRDAASGNLLLGRLLDLFIVNAQCQQQWTAKLPTGPGAKAYSVLPRAGGGVYATTGGPSTVIEYDGAGQILDQVGGKDVHSGIGLDFFSGFEILPNGNFVAANWQGHNDAPMDSTPHLVEFTPDNQLVWKWGNQTVARQITNTLMIR